MRHLRDPHDPLEDLLHAERMAILHRYLSGLPERQQFVLRLRFGFDDDRIWTLAEVGRELGVTGPRVRMIEAKAIRWFRDHAKDIAPEGHRTRSEILDFFCEGSDG